MSDSTDLNSFLKDELIGRLISLQEENLQLKHQVKERQKELRMAIELSSYLNKPELTYDSLLTEIVNLIPESFQYPERTCARITFWGNEYITVYFKPTQWCLSADICENQQPVGKIEVFYLEEKPESDSGPFLKEEQALIQTLADNLGIYSEKLALKLKLNQSEEKFSVLFQNSPVAKCIVDRTENYRILEVNDKFLNLTGFLREELEGDFLHAINFIVNDATKWIFSSETLNRTSAKDIELKFRNKSGDEKTGLLSCETINFQSKELILIVINDITESKESQRKAELQNQQNEKRLQGIFDTMQDAFFQADINGRFTFVNPTALHMYGFTTVDELIGQPTSILYANADTRLDLIEKLKVFAKINDFTAKARKKDGTTFWVSMNVQFVYDEKGSISGTQGIVRDITERIEFAHKLQESEKKFRDIFENMPSGYILFELIYDEQGNPVDHRLLEANAVFDEYTGLKRTEQLGLCSKELSWTWPDEVTQAYYNVAISGKTFSQERYNDSLNRYYDIRVSSPAKGQFALLFNDITKRKQAEEERYELLNRFQQIAKHIPGFIYQYHLRSDNSSHFPYASEAIKDIYGVSKEQARSDAQCVFDVLHPDDLQRVSDSIMESARNLTLWNDRYRVNLPTGRTIWVEGKSTPVKLEDGSVLWHGYIHDITELISYQEELIKAKEKAEESDKLKSVFLLNVAHEIRTPMNGILGLLQVLQQSVLSEADRSEFLSFINQSSERLIYTIENIIEISKIEIKDVKTDITRFDIQDVFIELYGKYNSTITSKGLDFVIRNMYEFAFFQINSDRQVIFKIFKHLLDNAIKFTPKGKIEIGASDLDASWCLYVSDTGTGMSESIQQHVLKPFVQADMGLSRTYEGLGVGLTIVKGYVDLLGGELKIESGIGTGSKFSIYIPKSQSYIKSDFK